MMVNPTNGSTIQIRAVVDILIINTSLLRIFSRCLQRI
nr:MAG TPA: hypothetical protein [Caudoviricetes sp.]DAT57468.1 MAG TPA: hypothetical protein [Caudoviricetes sp.]